MADGRARASRARTRVGYAALFGIVGAFVIGVVMMGFVWTAAASTPQNLPVGISGPADRVEALEDALAEQDPSPFELIAVDSREDAIEQIEDRTLYGAILLDEPEVLTATAAGPAAGQALNAVATQLQAQISEASHNALVEKVQQLGAALASGGAPSAPGQGAPQQKAPSEAMPSAVPHVTVTDVVPLADTDPTGSGFTAASFPLTLGGMLGGILLSLLIVGTVRRLVGLLVLGVVAGPLAALILQTWFGILQGDWLVNAAALGLMMTATAAFIIGMNAVFGQIGIGIGAVITVLIANPLASAAVPWQFLPEPWGAIGQFFVPGAGSNLIRSLSYFPEAPTALHWTVLAGWAVLGVVLALIGHFRDQADMRVPGNQFETVHAA
ncbi:hypothetical protein [Microbacterium sp.]|uniref:hypothetical protein n=1 Tax=Microbacterium sp. TaxID=51671 RepID=UPI003566E383